MIRFGIAGFGLHAVGRLMPGFRLSKQCQVTALSRRDQAKAQEAAQRFDIPHFFASTAEMCQSPDVDAVLVTSPTMRISTMCWPALPRASPCSAKNRWA